VWPLKVASGTAAAAAAEAAEAEEEEEGMDPARALVWYTAWVAALVDTSSRSPGDRGEAGRVSKGHRGGE
jgi:hypothetical protein